MLKECYEKLLNNISGVIKGKNEEITAVIAAMFSGGHILLEDIPGTGKTMLAKTLAKSIDCGFRRIQFTPDLLPSDITGLNVYNMKNQEFDLKKGPAFTNILLADEINRASPRTQSALLECMEEKQVTIDNESYSLNMPFMVIATQNPVETHGTYPLPEAQMDRFLIRLSLGYTEKATEIDILKGIGDEHPIDRITAVASADDIVKCGREVSQIKVSEIILEYIATIGENSRNNADIRLGISTRGLLAIKRVSQAFAGIDGRNFVTPDDVKRAAIYVIPHRIICRNYSVRDENPEINIVKTLLDRTPVPTEIIE